MSTTTFEGILNVGTAQGYSLVQIAVENLWVFAIFIAVLSGAVYFVLKRLHWI